MDIHMQLKRLYRLSILPLIVSATACIKASEFDYRKISGQANFMALHYTLSKNRKLSDHNWGKVNAEKARLGDKISCDERRRLSEEYGRTSAHSKNEEARIY